MLVYKKGIKIKFGDKDNKIFIGGVIAIAFSTAHKTIDYSILSYIDITMKFLFTIVIFLLTLIILRFTNILKKHTVVSLITLFIVDYILISSYSEKVEHLLFSKKINAEASIVKLYTMKLKDEFKHLTYYEKFLVKSSDNRLNNKVIYNTNYMKNSNLLKNNMVVNLSGTISDNIFKLEKIQFK